MQIILTASFLFDVSDIGTKVFFPLLHEGFMVKAQVDSSITNLLCEQFGLSSTYIEERIKTAFLDDMQSSSNERTRLAFGAVTCNNTVRPGRFRFHQDRFMNVTY